jgi:hypothetical protein
LLLVLLVLLLVSSCTPSAGPARPEVSHRQQKLVRADFGEVWRAAHDAIANTNLHVTEDDEAQGTIHLWARKAARSRPDALERELVRIADVEKARRLGLERLSEYLLDYTIAVARLGEQETRLEVSTQITAVDRSEVMMIAPGIVQVIPRTFDVPSKGILERDLVAQIAERLFLSEEMLYTIGALGRE